MNLEPHQLYIGKETESGEPLVYDGDDLTTHGVIVGMTGSGKTGLGVGLIEEALLHGIPCLVIDPKGDMGNLALVFPELTPQDFEPWIDEAEATKSNRTVAELAADTAGSWRKGLEGDGIGSDRLRKLAESAEVTVYTPGSGAGVGLDVLGSMKAPMKRSAWTMFGQCSVGGTSNGWPAHFHQSLAVRISCQVGTTPPTPLAAR